MDSIEKIATNPVFYTVKIADIMFIVVLYFVIGYYTSLIVNNIIDVLFGTDYESLTIGELVFELIFQICLNFIICRIAKKFINNIPFPLEGVAGFTHYKLKEFTEGGGNVWALGLLLYQRSFVKKFTNLKNKMLK
jgi:hypothetical protein